MPVDVSSTGASSGIVCTHLP